MKTYKEKIKKARTIPLLEVALSLYSAYAAILLFLVPGILDSDAGVYYNMSAVVPQSVWAFAFLIGAFAKSFGLLLGSDLLRKTGLGISTVIYGTVTICYAFEFPNLGTGVYFILSFMSAVSIFYVKKTAL